MKLIYVANIRFPTEKAHGLQIAKMCESFANAGVDLELWLPRRRNQIKTDPFEYYGVEKNFAIKKFWTLDFLFLSFLIPKVLFYLQTKTFLSSVKRALSQAKPEIIYSRDWLTVRFLLDEEVPVFWEVHNLPQKLDHIHQQILQKSAGLIVISQALKRELLTAGVSEEKIILAPDGVDLKDFQNKLSKAEARTTLGLPQDKKIVMYTGHLYEWKGARILLEAAKIFSNAPQSPLNLIGGEGELCFVFVGGTKGDVKKFEKEVKSADNVLLLGHKPHSEIPKYLAAADVLVLPNSAKENISKFYTSPMKLFEYMAANRPIVASNLPSIQEILNEKNAVLIKPDDPQALALGIKKVLENKELAEDISRQAWQDVQAYDWEARARRILGFIPTPS